MQAFRDYDFNKNLIILSVAICFSIAFFNAFGVSVTKNASAAQRSTIDTSRTVLIWIFFMLVRVYGEILETFKTLQLFGFILLVFGTLVFNEILIIPFLGFDRFTKKALLQAKQDESRGLLDTQTQVQAETPNYSGLSPHASYDSTRNQRNIENKVAEKLGQCIHAQDDVASEERVIPYRNQGDDN